MAGLALIAGAGALPAALVEALPERPFIASPEGFAPEGLAVDLSFRLERLVPFFAELHRQGIDRVCFAGAVQRPRLDPSLFDPATAQLVPRLLAAMAQGDDATLREFAALFEEEGLAVLAAHEIAPALVPQEGLIAGEMSTQDRQDATRAAVITQALGPVDVGQGCVVAGGICLAVEAIGGTDFMLSQVAALPAHLRPSAKGLLYKAPKAGQDLRFDMPTLGPNSVLAAAEAGLGGIVWAAGGVLCLDLPRMKELAEEKGLFLCARQK